MDLSVFDYVVHLSMGFIFIYIHIKNEPCFEQTKNVVVAVIFLKGFGGLGFIFGSNAGAILLVIKSFFANL